MKLRITHHLFLLAFLFITFISTVSADTYTVYVKKDASGTNCFHVVEGALLNITSDVLTYISITTKNAPTENPDYARLLLKHLPKEASDSELMHSVEEIELMNGNLAILDSLSSYDTSIDEIESNIEGISDTPHKIFIATMTALSKYEGKPLSDLSPEILANAVVNATRTITYDESLSSKIIEEGGGFIAVLCYDLHCHDIEETSLVKSFKPLFVLPSQSLRIEY